MIAELLCVGTELLMGQVLNTNAQFLSRRLAALGVTVYHQSVVGDNALRLEDALRLALSRADVVLTTGGLGPTADDITKRVTARVAGSELVLRPEAGVLAETGDLPCKVVLSCFMGAYQNYHVVVGDTLVKLADYCPVGRRVFRVGDTAYLSFREGCVHML